jgi:hypothetical protein
MGGYFIIGLSPPLLGQPKGHRHCEEVNILRSYLHSIYRRSNLKVETYPFWDCHLAPSLRDRTLFQTAQLEMTLNTSWVDRNCRTVELVNWESGIKQILAGLALPLRPLRLKL